MSTLDPAYVWLLCRKRKGFLARLFVALWWFARGAGFDNQYRKVRPYLKGRALNYSTSCKAGFRGHSVSAIQPLRIATLCPDHKGPAVEGVCCKVLRGIVWVWPSN